MDKELEKKAAAAEQQLIAEIDIPAFASRLEQHGIKWANDEEFAMLHAIGVQEYEQYLSQQRPANGVNPFLKAAYDATCGSQQNVDPDLAILAGAKQAVASAPALKQAALDYFSYFSQLQADAA